MRQAWVADFGVACVASRETRLWRVSVERVETLTQNVGNGTSKSSPPQTAGGQPRDRVWDCGSTRHFDLPRRVMDHLFAKKSLKSSRRRNSPETPTDITTGSRAELDVDPQGERAVPITIGSLR